MKRLAYITGLLLALLVLVMLAGPALIPWNEMRARAADSLSALTGRQVIIDGDLGVSFLPAPTLTARDVRIVDKGDVLATVERVDLRIRPLALLRGELRVEKLGLTGAELHGLLAADQPARWPVTITALGNAAGVESVTLSDGSLLLEHPGSPPVRLDGLTGDLSAGGPDGPFQLTAAAILDGTALRLTLNAARRAANGTMPVRTLLSLPDAKAEVRFTGAIPAGAKDKAEGDLVAQAPDAASLLHLLRHLPGLNGLTPPATGPMLVLRGRLSVGPEALAMDGIDLQWGGSRATGSVELRRAGDAGSAVVLSFTSLDIDGFLAGAPGSVPWAAAGALSLDLLADQARWRGDSLRDLRLVGRIDGNILQDADLSATLPGGTEIGLKGALDFTGEQPSLDAALTLNSDSLRDTLAWAGVPVDTVPVERLRKAALTGRLTGKPIDFALTEATGTLDTTSLSGALTVTRRARLGVGLRLTLDRLDLDAYRATDAAPLWQTLPPLLDGADVSVQAKADLLTLHHLPAEKLSVDAEWTGNALILRDASAASLAGLEVKASGHLTSQEASNSHLTLTAQGTSLAPLLRALGRPDPVLAERLGPVGLDARLVGDAERLTADIRAKALGGETHVGGMVDNPFAKKDTGRHLDLKIRSSLPETGDLLRLFIRDWQPAGPLGPIDAFAAVGGTTDGPLSIYDIQGILAGQPLKGALTWKPAAADGTAPSQLDGGLTLGAVNADLMAPVLTRNGEAWNLDWTRAMAMRLRLETPALTLGGEKLEAAVLPLTIAPGLIRLEGAEARWQGGSITVTGALEQTQADKLAETPDPAPLSTSLTLGVKDAAVPALLSGPALGLKPAGRFDLSFTGTAAGPTPRAALSAMTGRGRLSLRNGQVTGLDLGSVARTVAEGGPKGAANLRAALRKGGDIPVDSLSVDFDLADKVTGLSGLSAQGPQGGLSGAGRWSWRDRTVDLTLSVQPTSPKGVPALGLRLAGPDQGAVRTLDLGPADRWMAEREMQRLAKEQPASAPTPTAPAAPKAAPPKPTAPSAPAQPGADAVQGILDKLKRNP